MQFLSKKFNMSWQMLEYRCPYVVNTVATMSTQKKSYLYIFVTKSYCALKVDLSYNLSDILAEILNLFVDLVLVQKL